MAVVFCNRSWRIRVRVQGALRAADVTPLLVLAAILDMGRRSVTWQNSSSGCRHSRSDPDGEKVWKEVRVRQGNFTGQG